MESPAEKTEKSPLPVVAIDGVKIKSIRETKKLTQLYVASVVGVTTDTISRWENNRYPTIKRDNAEKLASALEVELAEILREDAEPIVEIPPAPAQDRSRHIVVGIGLALLILVTLLFFSRQWFSPPLVERKLPRFSAPGEVIPVQLRIRPNLSSASGLIIKERLPAGWRLVSSIPPAAAGPVGAEEVKWLVPSGSGGGAISYTVRVPPTAAVKTTCVFTGDVVIHGAGITRRSTSGDDRVTVAGIHWADRNGDGRIDDDEIMPAYYLTEEMKGLGLDWKTVEAIWSGKGYRWDPRTLQFEVIK